MPNPINDIVHISLEIEAKGTIEVLLDGENAPITVGNFLDLVQRGFYEGITFHRVVDDFVVQAGDPNSKDPDFPTNLLGREGFTDPETGLERTIPLEIKPEGADEPIVGQTFQDANISVPPVLRNNRGTIAMARSSDPNSASSQFYFNLDDSNFHDGSYAVFGNITDGLSVMDSIEEGDTILSISFSSLPTPIDSEYKAYFGDIPLIKAYAGYFLLWDGTDIVPYFNSLFSQFEARGIAPSLELVFDGRPLPPEATYTASSGKHYNAPRLTEGALDTPRYNWVNEDGVWRPIGLQMTPGYTNLYLNSGDFSSSWNTGRSYLETSTETLGDLNAKRLVPNTVSGAHHIYTIVPPVETGVYTASIYAKRGEYDGLSIYGQLLIDGTPFSQVARFDLTNGEVWETSGNQFLDAGSEYQGDGWWRLWLSYELSVAETTGHNTLFLVTDNNSIAFSGDNTSGVHIAAPQLTKTGAPKPYVATGASTVTVSGDKLEIDIQDKFTDELTFYLEIEPNNLTQGSETKSVFMLTNESIDNYITVVQNPDYFYYFISTNLSQPVFSRFSPVSDIKKIAFSINTQGNFFLAANGTTYDWSEANQPDIKRLAKLWLPKHNGIGVAHHHYKHCQIFPNSMSLLELQRLTTL